MPDLKNRLFRFYLKKFFPPDFSQQRSIEEQQKVFTAILSTVKNTLLGKALNLFQIETAQQYAQQVPLTQYGFYEPYVERIKAGERDVMTTDDVKWFGKTAGTTSGKSKLVPVTENYIRKGHVRGTFYGLSRLHSFDESIDILSHKNFAMTGGVYETLEQSGITVADISAIMMRNVPWPFRTIYAPDNDLMTDASWEHKLNAVPDVVKEEDIGAMIGVPTWHLTVLSKIHEEVPFEKLTDLWPNLRLFFHGGVNFEPYKKHFKELMGRDDFYFYEIYNATEGFFGAQAYPHKSDLLLLTDVGVFYEFIPFNDYDTERAKAVPLYEVKPGQQYVLVISTLDGLLRYVIGDVITFTGLNPFTFKITGRTQEYINAFGEDLLLGNVMNALVNTNEKFGVQIKEYTVAPFYIHLDEKGKMQFLIEFETAPADMDAYALELDEQLKRENSNYAQKRNNDLALSALQVIVAAPGTFYKWMESKGKLGGQNKMPHLVNNRRIMDELLKMQ